MSDDFQTVSAVFRDFSGDVCAACGKQKTRRHSFCRRCYARLSIDMQTALYRRFGVGYEEAFRAGLAWLRGNRED